MSEQLMSIAEAWSAQEGSYDRNNVIPTIGHIGVGGFSADTRGWHTIN
jgi:hypothetical protein